MVSAVGLIFLVLPLIVAAGKCDPNSRKDCGHSGTQKADCEAKGCCWQPAEEGALDVPWCFYKTGPTPPPTPPPPPSGPCDPGNRTDCGTFDTKEPDCLAKGCCWQPALGDNVPWCFYHGAPSEGCHTSPQCSGHGKCNGGICECSAPFISCGKAGAKDCSIDPATDINNCGGCGKKCASGPGVASSTCASSSCKVTCSAGYKLCFDACVQTDDCSKVAPYSEAEYDTFVKYFLDNIDIEGSGAVVASPSKSNPDYYYHWMRDAAISMNVLLNMDNGTKYDKQMANYVKWVQVVQKKPDTQCDVRGEPKFMIPSGDAYPGGWMRPQNDGAALRTITLVNYAMRKWNAGDKDYVTNTIWPLVQNDLKYVEEQYNQDSGDPWEELKADVFFTKICQRKSLVWGAKLATLLGNGGLALQYAGAAKKVEPLINAHIKPGEGWIMEIAETRELDSATHLGLLYGNSEDGFLSPTSQQAQASVAKLEEGFSNGYYKINDIDDAAGVPGLLVGRYLHDTYMNGCPWILTTNSLGEMQYLNAKAMAEERIVNITKTNVAFFQRAVQHSKQFSITPPGGDDMLKALETKLIRPGMVLRHADFPQEFHALAHVLVAKGDGSLLRVKHHIKDNNFHMQEQIGRDDGSSVSAIDLTWSYGTAIAALDTRKHALKAIARLSM